jgi:hypothetical protein
MQSLQCKSSKYFIFWGCGSSLRYTACNVHALYCHCGFTIFFHVSLTARFSGEGGRKLYSIKCVFWFLYNFCVKRFSSYEELNEI